MPLKVRDSLAAVWFAAQPPYFHQPPGEMLVEDTVVQRAGVSWRGALSFVVCGPSISIQGASPV